jgi:hypothetical protein
MEFFRGLTQFVHLHAEILPLTRVGLPSFLSLPIQQHAVWATENVAKWNKK